MKTMLLILATMMAFIMVPAFAYTQTTQASQASPPVEQPMVREGTLAVKLIDVLKLGKATNEVEAESRLTSVGIAPHNGWIADYPVTPDIANELRSAVSDASGAKTLAMRKDEALKVFDVTMSGYNLAVKSGDSGYTTNNESESAYPDNTTVNNYYYDEGPPIVTYYTPPYDYAGLYNWVPYPFWWWDFWFPGFFVLIDFHRPVFVNNTVVIVSNHFFNTSTRTVVTVDAVTRASVTTTVAKNTVIGPSVVSHGASTVFNTNRTSITSSRTGSSTVANNRVANTSWSGAGIRQTTGNRSLTAPSASRSFTRPEVGNRSFTAPSASGSSFRRPTAGNRSLTAPSASRSFTRPEVVNRSFSNRSFTAPSAGRMGSPSFTHGSSGGSSGGMKGGSFGGRRM